MTAGGLSRPGPTTRPGAEHRVRMAHLEWVAERLSERDWQIIETVNQLRLITGQQLEHLFFTQFIGHSRTVTRGRVLHRLVAWRVLDVLPRRIGGAAHGSAGAVFALGPAGARLLAERQAAAGGAIRVRHPGGPGDRLVRHTLAVSSLYVGLVARARLDGAAVVTFEAEPACWWPNGIGGRVQPDAYVQLALGSVREHWWVEADLGTESLPTVRRKLLAYLDFVHRGQLGPGDVVPRVLVSTVTAERCAAVALVAARLSEPAPALFVVTVDHKAALLMLGSLKE